MSQARAFLSALALLIGASCAALSIDNIAPPVSADDHQLYQGRRIYLTKCARCHAPEPVAKYSRSDWDRIMPEMIADTRLATADAEAVTRYVRQFCR
jgi:mono/diheme cytochrome c family protein